MQIFDSGDIVVYVGISHSARPDFYPPVGTVGIVITGDPIRPVVWWEDGSTSGDDMWAVYHKEIRKYATA